MRFPGLKTSTYLRKFSINVLKTQYVSTVLKTGIILNNIDNSVRTSQETHYVSATEANRTMPFREANAVHCENYKKQVVHTEPRNTTQLHSPMRLHGVVLT
jgi:hypothetical protein